jgi:branched-chain amino acid transport system permease protein
VDQFAQQLVNGLTLGSLYALIAVGYTVVYGIVQLINFAHGEIFMIGAFGALSTWLIFFEGETALWTLPIMLVGAIAASVLTAVTMERIAYRPLRNAPRLAPLITAIGISIFLQEAVRLGFNDPTLFLSNWNPLDFPSAKQKVPFPQIDVVTGQAFTLGGVTIQRSALFTIGCLVMCAAGLWYFVNRTKTGRGMQAVSQDPDTARLMGINVDRIIMVAFAVGATLAAVAGVAQGLQVTNINFKMGFLAGLKAFTAAVLGGIGNVWGAVVGGLTLGIVEAMAVQFIPGTFGGSPVEGRLGLRAAHHRPRLPAPGPPRCKGGGPGMSSSRTENLAAAHGGKAPMVAIAGGALLILSGLLSWSYDDRILDDISVRFFPIGIQIYAMGLGLVAVALGGAAHAAPGVVGPGQGPAHPRHRQHRLRPRHAHRDREAGRRRRERQ